MVWENVRYIPGRFLWIFIVLGCTIKVATIQKLIAEAFSHWPNKMLSWFFQHVIFISFIFHLSSFIFHLSSLILSIYTKVNVCLFVCLYSMVSKTIHLITAKFWEINRCICGKAFVNFHNPRMYHYVATI